MIGRRDALRMLAAGGVVAGVGACSFPAPRPPVKGGRLRAAVAVSSTADTLDPAKQSNGIDYCRGKMFYNGLTRLDADQKPELDLAAAIETRDGRVWTIRLRDDVRFHDGRPLTSADVVYSLRRHKDPAIGSKAKVFADQFADIRAMGPDTVRIELIGPNGDLPVILAITQLYIIRDGTTRFDTANGTGPFRCTEFQPGIRSIGTRNEDYFRGPVPLGEVEMFGIGDDNARVNALLSGDVDIVNAVNPRITRQVERAGYTIMESRTGTYTSLIMRLDGGPGEHPDFVRGMKLLQDREAMRTAIFRGFATIANDHPVPPTSPYFNAELPQRPFDPERARYHFKRAGMIGARIPMITSSAADKSDDMGVLIQAAAARAGIGIDLRRVPPDGYWTNSWMKVPVGFGNTNARPTPDIIFTQFFSSRAPWNESSWHDPRFDRMLLEARGSTDEGLRKRIYGEMQARIHDDAGLGIPLFISSIDAASPKVKGLHPMPGGGLMGFDFAANVWLEDA